MIFAAAFVTREMFAIPPDGVLLATKTLTMLLRCRNECSHASRPSDVRLVPLELLARMGHGWFSPTHRSAIRAARFAWGFLHEPAPLSFGVGVFEEDRTSLLLVVETFQLGIVISV